MAPDLEIRSRTLGQKGQKGVRAMKINIARTVRRTYALVEVVSVHAAASARNGFGQKKHK